MLFGAILTLSYTIYQVLAYFSTGFFLFCRKRRNIRAENSFRLKWLTSNRESEDKEIDYSSNMLAPGWSCRFRPTRLGAAICAVDSG